MYTEAPGASRGRSVYLCTLGGKWTFWNLQTAHTEQWLLKSSCSMFLFCFCVSLPPGLLEHSGPDGNKSNNNTIPKRHRTEVSAQPSLSIIEALLISCVTGPTPVLHAVASLRIRVKEQLLPRVCVHRTYFAQASDCFAPSLASLSASSLPTNPE